MFKIAKKRLIEWPVTIALPVDGGEIRKHTIDVTFEILRQSEMEASAVAGEDLLERIVQGWKRYLDEDDKPIEFSPEARRTLLDEPYVRSALFAAYGEIQSGKAARKNA